jgi:hypothetical protein
MVSKRIEMAATTVPRWEEEEEEEKEEGSVVEYGRERVSLGYLFCSIAFTVLFGVWVTNARVSACITV